MSASRVRPIRTEQDYASALARIEALMDRERSPAKDDEFDALATLVEAYRTGISRWMTTILSRRPNIAYGNNRRSHA